MFYSGRVQYGPCCVLQSVLCFTAGGFSTDRAEWSVLCFTVGGFSTDRAELTILCFTAGGFSTDRVEWSVLCFTAGGFSTDRAEETIMEAPKVPTLDLKNKRKPAVGGGGSVPMATDDDDRNLSVIDPGGDYGQSDVSTLCVVMTTASFWFFPSTNPMDWLRRISPT